MQKKIPNIKNQIFKEDVLKILNNKYSVIGPVWTSQQMEWCNGIYLTFKNHDKYLIVIYLIKKTLDFYSQNFTKLTYDEFYSHDTVEVGKVNVMDISNSLNIPKESTRRKLIELEKIGVLKRNANRCIIDRSLFPLVKPIKTTARISKFLAMFSKILVDENVLPKSFESHTIEKVLRKNFSYVWKLYYEMQVPMLLNWKKVFQDLETWHIWAVCSVNQHLENSAIEKKNYNEKNREEFLNDIFFLEKQNTSGINAMSLSDITGIPRATVIRKLNNLVKLNHLKIDLKKHYKLTGKSYVKKMKIQKDTFSHLANFSTIIFNLLLITVEENKNELETL